MAIKGETVLTGAPHPGTRLEVLQSPAGYYLGFTDPDGTPYSRETEYMPEQTAYAMLALIRNTDYRG